MRVLLGACGRGGASRYALNSMDDLYRDNILDHYKHPHNWGELEGADLEAEDLNPLCGDELRVQLAVDPDGTDRRPSLLRPRLRDLSGRGLDGLG